MGDHENRFLKNEMDDLIAIFTLYIYKKKRGDEEKDGVERETRVGMKNTKWTDECLTAEQEELWRWVCD